MPREVKISQIKKRVRREVKAPEPTRVYPESSVKTESGYVVSGYKGDFETLLERLDAGSISSLRLHPNLPRVYRLSNGYCLFCLVDMESGNKQEIVGSPDSEIIVPPNHAHFIKSHVSLDADLFIVQAKDYDEELQEEDVDKSTITPFDEAIHNHTPKAPLPKKRVKSKAAEQSVKKAMTGGREKQATGHTSVLDSVASLASQMAPMPGRPGLRADNQKPTILRPSDLKGSV